MRLPRSSTWTPRVRSASAIPATRIASGPIEAPRAPAPTSVGTPIRATVPVMLLLSTVLLSTVLLSTVLLSTVLLVDLLIQSLCRNSAPDHTSARLLTRWYPSVAPP